jgi:hypothetical protein
MQIICYNSLVLPVRSSCIIACLRVRVLSRRASRPQSRRQFFHIAGWMAALTVMHAGGRNLVVSKYDPKAAGKMIDREGVTFLV